MYLFIYFFFFFNYVQLSPSATILFQGTIFINPFGINVDANRGSTYFRLPPKSEPISDIQYVLSRSFAIPNFKSTLVLVISYDEVPEVRSLNPLIVSYQVYLKFMITS